MADYISAYTGAEIDAAVAAVNALPTPMQFKGTLGTGGTITVLPAADSSNEGFAYKVITAGTYAGETAKVGDMFISNGVLWTLIPSGDEPSGTVTNVAAGTGLTGGPITTSGSLSVDFSEVQAKAKTEQITLAAANWAGNAQTVACTIATASNILIITPASPTDDDNITAGGVWPSAQAAGSITFGCDVTPTAAIVLNVVAL